MRVSMAMAWSGRPGNLIPQAILDPSGLFQTPHTGVAKSIRDGIKLFRRHIHVLAPVRDVPGFDMVVLANQIDRLSATHQSSTNVFAGVIGAPAVSKLDVFEIVVR